MNALPTSFALLVLEQKYLEAIKNLREKEEESSKFRDQLDRELNEAYSKSKFIYMNNAIPTLFI